MEQTLQTKTKNNVGRITRRVRLSVELVASGYEVAAKKDGMMEGVGPKIPESRMSDAEEIPASRQQRSLIGLHQDRRTKRKFCHFEIWRDWDRFRYLNRFTLAD